MKIQSYEDYLMSVRVVGIRFKTAGKVYYFDPGEIVLEKGDHVVVETTRGVEFGEVVVAAKDVPDEEVVAPLKQVLRKATPEDHQQVEGNREKEKTAFQVAVEKIAAHALPMKLISVEQTFDGNKIIFTLLRTVV
ncbi:hypothetical protein N752_15475 [Desulforamulus aquiferis]|nr:hypothetical protein N752_15475 [Desulforamulus aquiferis]